MRKDANTAKWNPRNFPRGSTWSPIQAEISLEIYAVRHVLLSSDFWKALCVVQLFAFFKKEGTKMYEKDDYRQFMAAIKTLQDDHDMRSEIFVRKVWGNTRVIMICP